jgi:hypothetical protein
MPKFDDINVDDSIAFGTTPDPNRLYGPLIPKGWVDCVTNGSGGFTSEDGVGVSLGLSTSDLVCTFASPLSSYAVCAMINTTGFPVLQVKQTNLVQIRFIDDGGSTIQLQSSPHSVMVIILGRLQ